MEINEPKKTAQLALSVYGYGMMCFSTAVAILLGYGLFTQPDSDPYFSWGVTIFAGFSGALALAMVKSNFPDATIRNSLAIATVLNIFLFGSYLTSYLGYSRLMVIIKAPSLVDHAAISNLCDDLRISWLSAMVAAIFCTTVYFFIEWSAQSLMRSVAAVRSDDTSDALPG